MPVITKEQALELMTNAVREELGADEVPEVYNDIFSDKRYTAENTPEDVTPLVEQIVAYFNSGLEIDEVVDLWGMIFTKHRNIWYNEEEERIHFNEETEEVSAE